MGRPRRYEEDRVRTAIRVPRDLHDWLVDEAERRDISVSRLVEGLLERARGAPTERPIDWRRPGVSQ